MTIPKFIGALNRYQTVGASEMSYFTAADQFLTMVLNNHTYVTGGNSQDEHFRAPGKLDATRDNLNNESCNAYNMAKLGRELFKVTGDVKYADFYERVHINEVLSAMNPSTGMTTYFKPMGTGYFKAYGTADSTFWCCNGTGTENYTKLGDSLYFHDATDLYVIGYVSSTLNWKDRGLALTQTTDLPLTNKATFTVTAAPAGAVNIKFRSPYWLASCQSVSITVNGQAVTPVKSGGFLGVSQVWKAGDQIEVTLPMEVQVSRLPDNQNAVAFTYGPIVLSAGLGTAQMVTAGARRDHHGDHPLGRDGAGHHHHQQRHHHQQLAGQHPDEPGSNGGQAGVHAQEHGLGQQAHVHAAVPALPGPVRHLLQAGRHHGLDRHAPAVRTGGVSGTGGVPGSGGVSGSGGGPGGGGDWHRRDDGRRGNQRRRRPRWQRRRDGRQWRPGGQRWRGVGRQRRYRRRARYRRGAGDRRRAGLRRDHRRLRWQRQRRRQPVRWQQRHGGRSGRDGRRQRRLHVRAVRHHQRIGHADAGVAAGVGRHRPAPAPPPLVSYPRHS